MSAKRYKYKFKIEVYKPVGEGIAACNKAVAEAKVRGSGNSCRSTKVAKSNAEISIYSSTVGDTCGDYFPERDLSKFGPTQLHLVYRGTKSNITCTSIKKPFNEPIGPRVDYFIISTARSVTTEDIENSHVNIEYACNTKGVASSKGKYTCHANHLEFMARSGTARVAAELQGF